VVVSVNNTPPAASITSPLDGSTYELGAGTVNLTLSATISDAQSASNQLTCKWVVYLHHNYNHTHEEPAINACSGQAQVTPLGCESEIYFYEARLTVRDPQGLTTERSSFIYPNCPGNVAPVANADTAQVQSGGSVQVSVLANDVDADGLYPGSVRIVQPPARGSASVNSTTGIVTYVNNGASTTDDSFTYNVRDLIGKLSNTATVTVQVNAADTTAPTVPGGLSASAHGSSRVDLSWNASTDTGGSGLAGYRIYRNGGSSPVATVSGRTYSDYDRAGSTAYS
jgi:Bacterial Ig domain